MNKENLSFKEIAPFDMQISYIDIDADSPLNVNYSHMHKECEIYINLSGNVSFAVEGSVYPVVPGSVIITRPYEYHHCIYHSNERHRHFWILFSAAGNERLFDIFFKRSPGKSNMLLLSAEEKEELQELCFKLNSSCSELKKYSLFFRIMDILSSSDRLAAPDAPENFMLKAISYIDNHFSEKISVKEVAAVCGVGINTLERHFSRLMNVTPHIYIRKRRLINAVRLLSAGKSVTEAAELSGFSDVSCFIELFKKNYGATPLKYKRLISQASDNAYK